MIDRLRERIKDLRKSPLFVAVMRSYRLILCILLPAAIMRILLPSLAPAFEVLVKLCCAAISLLFVNAFIQKIRILRKMHFCKPFTTFFCLICIFCFAVHFIGTILEVLGVTF